MSDLVPLPTFEGKEIRAIEKDGDVWIPLTDLAEAWGIDRTTPAKLIMRNGEIFEGCIGGDVTSHDDPPSVNERGLYLLMGKISADRLKNPEARAAIIRFQRWVPDLIQRYRKKEIVQVVSIDGIKAELLQAGEFADTCKKSPELFQAAIFRKHGMTEYADALQVPSVVHAGTGWYNPTGLVELCNDPLLNAERLNWYLKNNPKDPERRPFQYRDENGIWRLTALGMEHGKEYWYTAPSQHQEVRIAWRESVLYASGLRRSISTDQAALPAKAGS